MSKILFTGGLGDILAVEARMSNSERFAVKEIYLATPGAKTIMTALKYHYLWRDLPVKEILTKEQIQKYAPSKYCIHSLNELNNVCITANATMPPPGLIDMSIIKIFGEIRSNQRPWAGSGFAFPRYECDLVCDLATTSGDSRIKNRNFTSEEIGRVKEYAGKRKVIYLGEGNTTFDEFVGYTLGCREYIGVDSASSVLAAIDKVYFKGKKIFIRANNPAWYNHRASWYPPDALDFFYASEYSPR